MDGYREVWYCVSISHVQINAYDSGAIIKEISGSY